MITGIALLGVSAPGGPVLKRTTLFSLYMIANRSAVYKRTTQDDESVKSSLKMYKLVFALRDCQLVCSAPLHNTR